MVDYKQKIEIEITKMSRKRFREMGFFVEVGDKIEVELETLIKFKTGTKYYADVECDYCGKSVKILIGNLLKILSSHNPKISCAKCAPQKTKETNMLKYGVTSSFERKEVLEKIKKTNLERWGVPHVSQSKDFQELRKETNIKKYGSSSPFGNKEIIEKTKKTLKKNYGVENPSQSDIIQEKVRKTLNEHGLEKASKQQIQLWEYIGGELNYPFKRYSLDIAFVEEKIDIEYNGGGHNLLVKTGQITENKFIQKENYRKKQLYSENWKIVTFISPRSKMLEKQIVLDIIYSCKNYFNKENRHWVEIYIDKNIIKTSKFEIKIQDFINKYK